MRAIEALREVNRKATALPKSAPTGFVRQRWASLVLPGGAIDRRHYEVCVLSELRDRLRAGDVWVTGSRQYRSFEERLISQATLNDMQEASALPVAAEPDFEQFIAGRHTLLDARLAAVDVRTKDGLLPDVSIDRGVLKIAPIQKSTPPGAETLVARLYAMLPRIPDLKHRRLYSFGKPSEYSTLEPMIAGRINLALIRAHWKAILRIVASIRPGQCGPARRLRGSQHHHARSAR